MDDIKSFFLPRLACPVAMEEYWVLHWRASKLSYDEVCSLYDILCNLWGSGDETVDTEYDWGRVNDLMRYLWQRKIEYEGGYKSVNALIAELDGPDGDNAVRDLTDCLFYQSAEEQKRIYAALLNSKHHRMDAYSIINDSLAEYFIETLQRNWLEYGDVNSEMVKYIIKFSSEEFLLEHHEQLIESCCHYDLLCFRLANNPEFVVDESAFYNRRLYYTAMSALGRGITRKDILVELFSYIKEALLNDEAIFEEVVSDLQPQSRLQMYLTTKCMPEVSIAIYAMERAGMDEELHFYYQWNLDMQRKAAAKIDEIENLSTLKPISYLARWLIFCDIARHNFPDVTQLLQRTNECSAEMRVKLEPMIEEFGLELVEANPFTDFPLPSLKFVPELRFGRLQSNDSPF